MKKCIVRKLQIWTAAVRDQFLRRWAMRRLAVSLLTLSLMALGPGASPATAQGVYPQGSAFPLQLYELVNRCRTDGDIALVAPDGWNIGHGYCWADGGTGTDSLNALLQNLAQSGMQGLPALPAFGIVDDTGRTEWEENDIRAWIQALAPNANIAYWDLPEELRSYGHFTETEYRVVQDYTAWTRTYDPLKRPNFMYIPPNYTQAQVQNYVQYLDIIPATASADRRGMPHAWVRWRMEETIRGIEARAVIGSDYLNGEKTPVGVVQLSGFNDPVIPTADQTYHDFWQLIASGAKGIFVFSYARRLDQGGALIPNWNRLREAASQISGPEQLGAMILYGQPVTGVTVTILSGPEQTVSFTPERYDTPVQFPSIHVFCQQWNGSNYLIAVNSTDQSVTASFANLPPTGSDGATVLFESRGVSISEAGFTDSFPAWGVHIYRF